MRIAHQKVTIRSILFSRPAAIVYFFALCFFTYKSILLLPVWLTIKDKAQVAEMDYNKKIAYADQKKLDQATSQTDMGKERYQKDFFNKLDSGENLIILYGDETSTLPQEEDKRKMFWWEVQEQNFVVWWKNLQIIKK